MIVPAAPVWRKSTRSANSSCVEVALASDIVGVRDSKDPAGPVLSLTADVWRSFVNDVKDGQFDRP